MARATASSVPGAVVARSMQASARRRDGRGGRGGAVAGVGAQQAGAGGEEGGGLQGVEGDPGDGLDGWQGAGEIAEPGEEREPGTGQDPALQAACRAEPYGAAAARTLG